MAISIGYYLFFAINVVFEPNSTRVRNGSVIILLNVQVQYIRVIITVIIITYCVHTFVNENIKPF